MSEKPVSPPNPRPPKHDRMICSCSKSATGDWLRDADGYFITNEKCVIHGSSKKWWEDNVWKKSLEYDAKR